MSRAGGRYACLELPSTSVLESRKAVSWRFVMAYEVFGKRIALDKGYGREGKAEHREKAVRWTAEMQDLLEKGLVKCHPVEMLQGKVGREYSIGFGEIEERGGSGREVGSSNP